MSEIRSTSFHLLKTVIAQKTIIYPYPRINIIIPTKIPASKKAFLPILTSLNNRAPKRKDTITLPLLNTETTEIKEFSKSSA